MNKVKKILIIILTVLVLCSSLSYFVFYSESTISKTKSNIPYKKEEQSVTWGRKAVIEDRFTGIQNKIKVAILDNGIYKEHEDLKGKVVKEFNTINLNNPIIDETGHGTAIAGIIAAENNNLGILGVMPNIQLYDVKVLDKQGKGDVDHLIKGIRWCIEQRVNILNISFGLQSESPELKKAIDEAVDSGIIVVAAAGNTYGLGVDYPAKYENVISISSVNKEFKRASSSAKGKIDFAAPGVDILSTNQDGGYSTYSGTSFATAFATGVIAALLAEGDNTLNLDQIKKILIERSIDLGSTGYDNEFGYGLIQK
ncbi:S8 family peptidase [Bacillus thuringiensis]|uniref:Peptidase S8 n=1 Tax=Bacillus thuringiensis TaxID=1428 RepID=A0A9W3XM49_BACTU|nr:S8 family peptidase [Bacillus thuringiensis]AQY42491.1 peptidase S8 [Bacillus thuringiensis]MDR4148628.1 S8 family peptidase [Bacillus thuringiensis]MEC3569976.1 S8 family peptidase [Bacillus thuringiensis]MED2021620.1 S8 family peptidase [Bacillus thuringiensis]MED2140570.1 S8 family peptidase [Bacillus thuringiensis]